jgi:uncharacterized protein YlzI (FlbEa/FlbD family)
MQIELNRIYRSNLQEHEDVTRRKRIYYNSIESIEEDEGDICEVTLTWGEKMLVRGDYETLLNRLETIKQEMEDEERKRDLLG